MQSSDYAQAAAVDKQERQVAAIMRSAASHVSDLQEAVNRTDEMRGRLLGLREPAQLNKTRDDVPTANVHELAELRLSMERIGSLLEKLHSNLRDLESI